MQGKINWDETVKWIFYGVVGFMLNRATSTLDKLQIDVAELNTKIATIVAKTETKFEIYDYRLDKQLQRITDLEKAERDSKKKN